jgi:hypothetical protein
MAACGAENLCHQAIFVDHAVGAVAPPDARDTTRKTSFKPISRRSSHLRPSQNRPADTEPLDRTDRDPKGIYPDGTGFRHPQAKKPANEQADDRADYPATIPAGTAVEA